uniref:Uncharacterized protein n=1 Tax=Acrobeloides nanus TaxID=290746 RepID=A0A914EJK6_9BILA
MDAHSSEHKEQYKKAITWLEKDLNGNCSTCRFTCKAIICLYSGLAMNKLDELGGLPTSEVLNLGERLKKSVRAQTPLREFTNQHSPKNELLKLQLEQVQSRNRDLVRSNQVLITEMNFLTPENVILLEENRHLRSEIKAIDDENFRIKMNMEKLKRDLKLTEEKNEVLDKKNVLYLRRIESLSKELDKTQIMLIESNHQIKSSARIKEDNQALRETIERQKELIARLEGERYDPPVRRTLCFSRQFSVSSTVDMRSGMSSPSPFYTSDSGCEATIFSSSRCLTPVEELSLVEILATTNERAEVFERDPSSDTEEDINGYIVASPCDMKKRARPPNSKSFLRKQPKIISL